MSTPKRIQLHRTAGWRKDDHSPNGLPVKSVARGSRWGNPFSIRHIRWGLVRDGYDFSSNPGGPGWEAYHRCGTINLPRNMSRLPSRRLLTLIAVEWYREFIEAWREHHPDDFEAWIAPLRGCNVGCFCALDAMCHGDYLLELAEANR